MRSFLHDRPEIPRKSARAGIAVLLLLVAGAAGTRADRSSLIENSPFVWEGFVPPEERQPQRNKEPPPSPPEDDPLDRLELRGIIEMEGETRFSLFHPDNQESFWLTAGESEAGYTVVAYEEGDSVRVRREGTERTITLKEAEVKELSEEQRRRQARNSPGESTDAGDTEASSAEESEERLRRAAEELRRRRAIRRGSQEEN